MSTCIPETPFANSPDSHVRVFAYLRRLPDSWVVFQCLPLNGHGVDFWLHDELQRVVLLKVMETTPAELAEALLRREAVGTAEHESLTRWAWPAAVLFPHLRHKEVAHLPRPTAALFVPKEQLMAPQLATWLTSNISQPLTKDELDQLRQQLAPEVVIPLSFSPRPHPNLRQLDAKLTQLLLDYNQEQVVKGDLDLTEEGQSATQNFKLKVVTGVAGSGKSLIILYRARLLRQLYPHKRILVLTHNRALIRDLRARFTQILPEPKQSVHWFTFLNWCNWLYKRQGKQLPDIAPYRLRQEAVQAAWQTHLSHTNLSPSLLEEEISWYKDRLLFQLDDYLAADRTGRGFALTAVMRERVYQAMENYHQILRERGLIDWADVPRQLWRETEDSVADKYRYDFILVDEAQFFAPLWYNIIKKMLKPLGQLFLVADPTQGFLKRRESWVASGLVVHGRHIQHLRHSYRTTRQILDFATWFYNSRLPDDPEYIPADLANMPTGTVPLWLHSTSKQDEVTQLISEIRALDTAGHHLGQILIIHPSVHTAQTIGERLQQAFGAENVVDPRDEAGHGRLRVCPLNGATGLESPIVFLMGIHELYEQEASLNLSDEERQELIRDNTRRLYMAMTRAGQKLILSYRGTLPKPLHMLVTNFTPQEPDQVLFQMGNQ